MGLFFTDLTCVIASTTLTSAAGGFDATMVNKTIEIISGTNFTTGVYTITGHTDTNTVTINVTACDGVGNATSGVGSLEFLSWLRQGPEPLPAPVMSPVPPLVELRGPPFYQTVKMDSWFRQTVVPMVPPREPLQGWWAGVTERTLFETPNMDTWFCQFPDPMRLIIHPEQRKITKVEAAHEAIIPKMDSWFSQTSEPVRETEQPLQGWWGGVTERTLFETPITGWMIQQPDPLAAPIQLPGPINIEPPEYRPFTIGSELLSWYQQQPGPIIMGWDQGDLSGAQPPAVTPDDPTAATTDTAHFGKAEDDDQIYPRNREA